MGMVQPRRYPDLSEEPISSHRGREMRIEHLERDLSIVLEIVREIDDGHPSMTYLALNGVTVLQNRGEVMLDLGQTAFREGCTLHSITASPAEPEDLSEHHACIAAAITPGTRIQLEFSSSAVIRGISTCALLWLGK